MNESEDFRETPRLAHRMCAASFGISSAQQCVMIYFTEEIFEGKVRSCEIRKPFLYTLKE
jgi:hypothetical protein